MDYRAFRLLLAVAADSQVIWELANDPLVRSMSFLSKPIPWDEHVEWYQGQLSSPNVVFYVLKSDDECFLGNVRFTMEGNVARISFALVAMARGRGLATNVIEMACARLFEEQPVERIEAFIRPGNASSIKAFVRSGFERIRDTIAHGEPALLFELPRSH